MSIELSSIAITLDIPNPAVCGSQVEHRARAWRGVSVLSQAIKGAGMEREIMVRSHDRDGHVAVEATQDGITFLSSLSLIAAMRPRLRH